MVAAKVPDVAKRLAEAFIKDVIRFSDHAQHRMDERLYEYGLDESDVFRVLKKGRREEEEEEEEAEKDEWNEILKEWNYAYRGKTLDGIELRVAFALKPNGVLVVTVINLG
jgi:molybdopterin-biosynthesis enzyme MoeA-like protein